MNIGGRIIQRLGAIEKDRQWLLGKVENLSDQALSNLIRRDSRRSEWDEAIAAALGVSVLWLVYGKDQEEHLVREEHGVYQLFSDATREVIDTMEALEPERQREVAVFARERMTLQNADHVTKCRPEKLYAARQKVIPHWPRGGRDTTNVILITKWKSRNLG